MPELTPWYPWQLSPKRRGWYDTKTTTLEMRLYWNGVEWHNTVELGDLIVWSQVGRAWRGLTQPIA